MESVFYQILSVPLDVTAMENAGAPPAVRDLVMRCTAKSASDRPQGFPPIIEALRAILSGAEGNRPQTVPQQVSQAMAAAPPQSPRKEISPAGPMWRLSLVTYGLVLLVTMMSWITGTETCVARTLRSARGAATVPTLIGTRATGLIRSALKSPVPMGYLCADAGSLYG